MDRAVPAILHYVAHTRPHRRYLRLILTIALISLVLAVPFVSVQTRTRVDALTGSVETQTVWFNRFSTSPSIKQSALELRLQKMNALPSRDWRFLNNTRRTIFSTIRESGTAPPIFLLNSFMDQVAATHSDGAILALVHILSNGSPEQQRAAVQAAGEKTLDALAP